jgi:hypothetical protein
MTEEERLNAIISRSLCELPGDPDDNDLQAAADAYILLKQKGLNVDGEHLVVRQLRRDNVYEDDFLSEMNDPPEIVEEDDKVDEIVIQQIDNLEALEKEAVDLVSKASVIDIVFFTDPSHEPPVADSCEDLLEIFGRKKLHIQQYYEGQEIEIAYSLAMASMFNGATIDLRNMSPQDKTNYRYAVDFWKKHLLKFDLMKRADSFEKLIKQYAENPSEENRQVCLDMICENCCVDLETAQAIVP